MDVLAVEATRRLQVSRSLLECKSGLGQSKEPDRLLWLAGLRGLLEVDRAVLVRQTITKRGRDLAARLRLSTLDMRTLQAREASIAWVPERFAHVDGAACLAAEKRVDVQLKGLAWLPSSLIAFLRFDALIARPHQILGALTTLGEVASTKGTLPEPTDVVVAGHALVDLLIAACEDARHLDQVGRLELEARVMRGHMTGDPDDQHTLEVIASANKLMRYYLEQVHQAYVDSGITRRDVDVPDLGSVVAAPAPWVGRYADLVEALRNNGRIAADILQTAELACFDALAGDTNYQARAFDHLFTPEHRQMLRLAVRVLREVSGPAIADRLGGLNDLDFERSAPAVPDRQVPAKATATAATEATAEGSVLPAPEPEQLTTDN
ncbi:MAG: hypothetical protein GC157_17425 [Frankiales bacterium]|nr:hypothetical protein [Frankiales bacterium]